MLRDFLLKVILTQPFFVLTEESKKSRDKGLEVFGQQVFCSFKRPLCSLGVIYFSEEIVLMIAPSFNERVEVFQVTVNSVQVLIFLTPSFSCGVEYVLSQYKKSIFCTCFSSASLNVMMILSIVFMTLFLFLMEFSLSMP